MVGFFGVETWAELLISPIGDAPPAGHTNTDDTALHSTVKEQYKQR